MVLCFAVPIFHSALFQPSYGSAVSSAKQIVPFISEFEKLYPGAAGSIACFSGDSPTWQSKVALHGRYILTMQVDLTLSVLRNHVLSYSEPSFFLVEVKESTRLPDGRWSATYEEGTQKHFGVAQWKKLGATGGDLSALGIAVKRNAPVPGFETNWEWW